MVFKMTLGIQSPKYHPVFVTLPVDNWVYDMAYKLILIIGVSAHELELNVPPAPLSFHFTMPIGRIFFTCNGIDNLYMK